MKDLTIATVAASGRYLVWEAAGSDENPVTLLMQRDLKTREVKQLDDETLPSWGLASTSTWVAYVADMAPARLVALRHDGSDRSVLSRALIAPIDARGSLVAWAEGNTSRQRVVVREMESGREWVAAEFPRCVADRCYRIDGVRLAEQGIVFARGAIGPQPSLILRRAFDDAKPTIVTVPRDPQPDLARSSAGAFYYQLQRGWMRWDFGEARPGLTAIRRVGPGEPTPLGYERGSLLLATGPSCRTTLVVRGRNGRTFRLVPPASTPYSPKEFGPLCRQLTAAFWTGRKLVAAWMVIPKLSLEAHGDVGLAGVAVAAGTPG